MRLQWTDRDEDMLEYGKEYQEDVYLNFDLILIKE